ncbi:ectoine/hydroxyectoine ABC transporter permease subunit EhuD [Actinopolymorpha sp. B17G11]|uniref:ectoine/hydroxyectoine ABC transporter permease subunit EhuD n=1 Tax=unclassified Actinopolymorpha TaxID=2627063 RepID=UPI0032D99BA4
MNWDWGFVAENLPLLLDGLKITVFATILGSLVALVVGLVLALLRRSNVRAVQLSATAVVEFIRSTPLLVQLYFLFFVLPALGLTLPALATGVIGLGLHYAAYMSEVYRAGIDGVPRGQWEACTALSLPRRKVWADVILPQAIPRVLPALGNYIIAMFKDTPLLSAITVGEMLLAAKTVGSETFRYLEPITMVGLLFLVVSILAAVPLRVLERRFGH